MDSRIRHRGGPPPPRGNRLTPRAALLLLAAFAPACPRSPQPPDSGAPQLDLRRQREAQSGPPEGGAPAPAAEPGEAAWPRTAPALCKEIVDHNVQLRRSEYREHGVPTRVEPDLMLRESCEQDRWPPGAAACLRSADDLERWRACLTPALRGVYGRRFWRRAFPD